MEDGNQGWTPQPAWAITTETAFSSTHSWTDTPGSDYGNNVSTWLESPSIPVDGVQDLRLEFASLCHTEATYDYCIVEVTTDDVSWNEVARYDGPGGGWQNIVLELPQLAGATTIRIRFRLESDFSNTDDGWHVDDIRLRGAGPQCLTEDADSDGVTDGVDNCTFVSNPDQRDTNDDGFGNICDPDLDDSGLVNLADLQIMRDNFFMTGDLDTDFDGDGFTNLSDLQVMRNYFFGPPGPAAK